MRIIARPGEQLGPQTLTNTQKLNATDWLTLVHNFGSGIHEANFCPLSSSCAQHIMPRVPEGQPESVTLEG